MATFWVTSVRAGDAKAQELTDAQIVILSRLNSASSSQRGTLDAAKEALDVVRPGWFERYVQVVAASLPVAREIFDERNTNAAPEVDFEAILSELVEAAPNRLDVRIFAAVTPASRPGATDRLQSFEDMGQASALYWRWRARVARTAELQLAAAAKCIRLAEADPTCKRVYMRALEAFRHPGCPSKNLSRPVRVFAASEARSKLYQVPVEANDQRLFRTAKPGLAPRHISGIWESRSVDPMGGDGTIFVLTLHEAGADALESLTRGAVGKRAVVLFGDQVLTAPTINEPFRATSLKLSLWPLEGPDGWRIERFCKDSQLRPLPPEAELRSAEK